MTLGNICSVAANASEYFSIVNNTDLNEAQAHGALPISRVVCNASPVFCHIYLDTYNKVFPTNAPYYAGSQAGALLTSSMLLCYNSTNHRIIGHQHATTTA
jgi:hypothetical protein